MSENNTTHKDHMPNRRKEKIGTMFFLISGSLLLCLVLVYMFAYAVPESKAEKQRAEEIETQQREYLDDKFANTMFNKMFRGTLNEKNNIIQVLYPYQQSLIEGESGNKDFTIAISESYFVKNNGKEEDSLCAYVRIKADKDLVHLTNNNFAYIVDNSGSKKNIFEEDNKGQINNDRKQFPVSLEGTHVDIDRFDKNGISDASVSVHPHQEEEFSLCVPTSVKTDISKDEVYRWAVLNSDGESLAQWDVPVSDVLENNKTRKFKF